MEKKKILILCDASQYVGLGHYSRSRVLRKIILNSIKKKYIIKIILVSNKNVNSLNRKDLIPYNNKLIKKLNLNIINFSPQIIFFNFSNFFERKYFGKLIRKIYTKEIKFIAIDNLLKFKQYLSCIWIPNIIIGKKNISKKIYFGWDKIIIEKIKRKKIIKRNILFLIGGTDKYKLSKKIPKMLDENLQKKYKIDWVQGPFAKSPLIKDKFRKNWKIYKNPKNVYRLLDRAKCCFVLFGTSFFETVNACIPQVTYSPKGKEKPILIKALKRNFLVESNLKISLNKINLILNNYKKFENLAHRNNKLITFKKRDKFLKHILN